MLRLALLFALALAPLAAGAQTADFSGTLSTFTGGGGSIPTTATPIAGGAEGISFGLGGSGFTIPAGVFTLNTTTPAGFTANASPSSFYTIRSITNTSNGPGTFSTGALGYGGVMGTGSDVAVELGIVPLPNVFGSLVLPINVGSSGTAIATASILANRITLSVAGQSWTTATVIVSDQTASAPTATTASSATVAGSNSLTANGGQITLVTPYLIRIRGAQNENRAGYAVLTLDFTNLVPEPAAGALLATAGVLLVAGRRRRR